MWIPILPRKTECGAKPFLTRLAVRAAPFALVGNADYARVDRGTLARLSFPIARAAFLMGIRESTDLGVPRYRLETTTGRGLALVWAF